MWQWGSEIIQKIGKISNLPRPAHFEDWFLKLICETSLSLGSQDLLLAILYGFFSLSFSRIFFWEWIVAIYTICQFPVNMPWIYLSKSSSIFGLNFFMLFQPTFFENFQAGYTYFSSIQNDAKFEREMKFSREISYWAFLKTMGLIFVVQLSMKIFSSKPFRNRMKEKRF